jgi:hypothetical protein
MSERLQRYFAAVLGCAIAATWAAAGFGPALAGLIASAVAYAAVAFSQQRSLLQSGHGRTVERPQVTAARRTSRDPAQPSGRRPSRAAARPARRPATERTVLSAELTDAPDERPAIPATGRYGW